MSPPMPTPAATMNAEGIHQASLPDDSTERLMTAPSLSSTRGVSRSAMARCRTPLQACCPVVASAYSFSHARDGRRGFEALRFPHCRGVISY